jgi:hypothetical protein
VNEPEDIVADVSYATEDSATAGDHKTCERCATELELRQPFGPDSRMMWAEMAKLPNMCMVHVQSRCDVIAQGGDPDYRPPAQPRTPKCKARLTRWADSHSGWVNTDACTRDLDHPGGVHSNGMAWWDDDESDPPGFKIEDLPQVERREKLRFDVLGGGFGGTLRVDR